ncbi:MAG TPA: HypC/HybG/HupF family hydrogenase formation chaperone [Chloroflexia bacterium]|nr:HypC/HybG/HupF family hydrogenase formation chaperone [Chloroflexia bacterium]
MCLGIPGQILEVVDEAGGLARVEVSGVRRNVNISLLGADSIQSGDWVLIHVGFAMSKINEQEAFETLKLLQQMDQAFQDELKLMEQSQLD